MVGVVSVGSPSIQILNLVLFFLSNVLDAQVLQVRVDFSIFVSIFLGHCEGQFLDAL